MRNRVFVFTMDGACFERLLPWMDQGVLPNLESMMKQGVSGEIESTIPPVSATAWSSFMTGKNPGKHGIFDFLQPVEGSYRFQPIHSFTRKGKTLWEILSENGKKVVVVNVPTTYPSKPVNGAWISDFISPEGKDDFMYPRSLLDEIQEKFGPYPLFLVPPNFLYGRFDLGLIEYIDRLKEVLAYRFRVAHYLLEKVDPDFLMLHLHGNDLISHYFWHIFDRNHPQFSEENMEKYGPKILEYYQDYDRELGIFLDVLPPETGMIVVSDHGIGPMHGIFDLNNWLMKEGYTVLKKGPVTKVRHWLWRRGVTLELFLNWLVKLGIARLFGRSRSLRSKNAQPARRKGVVLLKLLKALKHGMPYLLKLLPFISIRDVDWSRTQAFAGPGYGQVYINLEGEFPSGCVPADKGQSLSQEIASKLLEIVVPGTVRRINADTYTKDEIYHGDRYRFAPDVTFLPIEEGYLPRCILGFRSREPFSDLKDATGDHTMKGILIADKGNFVKGLRVEGARLIDLAPTILYMMGLKIPPDMDGRVLEKIIKEDFLRRMPVEFCEESTDGKTGNYELSPEDQEEIVRKLKGLGYLG